MTVSVIIPAFNSARFLGAAIESVMRQTYRDYEIIVVDDGSTDATDSVLARWAGPVKCIRQPHSGASAARNAGLRAASGELIAFLDADDLLLPNKLEAQVRFLETHPDFGFVHSSWYFLTETGRLIPYTLHKRSPDQQLERMLLDNDVIMHACLFRRSCFDSFGGFDESITMSEDWDTWLRFAASGVRIGCTYDRLVVYRMHDSNSHVFRAADPSRLAVIDRFFGRPDLPEHIRELERQVKAENALHCAGSFYRAGDYEAGSSYLKEYLRSQSECSVRSPYRTMAVTSFDKLRMCPATTELPRLALLVLPVRLYGIESARLAGMRASDLRSGLASIADAVAESMNVGLERRRCLEGVLFGAIARVAYDQRHLRLSMECALEAMKTYRGQIPACAAIMVKCAARALAGSGNGQNKAPGELGAVLDFIRGCEEIAPQVVAR